MRRVPAVKTVDDYLAGLPEPARATLTKVCATIRSVVPPGNSEGISYGMPVFRNKRVLLWVGAFANHCSLFPGAAVLAALKSQLKGLRTSKGTIQFPVDRHLSAALIKKLVNAAQVRCQ